MKVLPGASLEVALGDGTDHMLPTSRRRHTRRSATPCPVINPYIKTDLAAVWQPAGPCASPQTRGVTGELTGARAS